MKYSSLRFLAKSNIKGNKKRTAAIILTCLLVTAITIISCFAVVTVNAVNEYKQDYKARALYLSPYFDRLTDSAINAISNVEHVEYVDDITGLQGICSFDITDISDDNDKADLDERFQSEESVIYVNGLMEHEEKSLVAGDNLDNAPVFSCLVPSLFYPFPDKEENVNGHYYEDLDYVDGTTLIGKTITVKSNEDKITIKYNHDPSAIDGGSDTVNLPSIEFKLKIVGTYYCSPTPSGYFADVYVSRETDLLITQMTMEAAGYDLSSNDSDLVRWWNDPSIHSYYVVVDDYSNISEVYNTVHGMGYDIVDIPSQLIIDSTVTMANLFSTVGVFLIFAIGVLAIVILMQSSINSIKDRKSYIGLLKAVGYKNRQIFSSLCYEQLCLTMKGFLIGGSFSTVLVAVTNYIFNHNSYNNRIYIIDWSLFLTFLGISLAIAIIVPLLCQLILLRRLTEIQPKDAMNSK